MRRAFAVFAMFVAAEALACSIDFDSEWQTRISNEPVRSANGRYCAIVREYDVADFESALSDDTSTRDAAPTADVVVAMYDLSASKPRLIGEFPADKYAAHRVLVSDSGRYVVAVGRPSSGCIVMPVAAEDDLVTIYDPNGVRVGTRKAGELFDAYDLWYLDGTGVVEFALRGDVLVVSVAANDRAAQRRIDLATAALLDAKEPIFPQPRVFATSAANAPARPYAPASPQCAAAFDDPDVIRLPSARVFAAAIEKPVPDFPIILMKARVRGTVRVEVIVSETGEVLCTRHTYLPFGADVAAEAAARKWRFEPIIIDGKPAKFSGDTLLHFEDVDPPRM